MQLESLRLEDKAIFQKYLGLSRHELSAYSFANIYIWKGLFDIRWAIIQGHICVFFRDKIGCFLYLAPLAKNLKPEAMHKAFEIMDGLNQNPEVSRIENIEEKELLFYRSLGYRCRPKYPEYLYLGKDLAGLSGNKFKSQRASYNYCIKHHAVEFLPFAFRRHRQACHKLHDLWIKRRWLRNPDPLYRGMLADSRKCLEVLLKDYRGLGLVGRVACIGKEVSAFTFGFKLSPDTFCILYEITDLTVKGLSQFIFRQFCREQDDCKYVNIMDDSGLENLKRVKNSYRPARLVPAYIVTRENAKAH
jgi:hypothetical protein